MKSHTLILAQQNVSGNIQTSNLNRHHEIFRIFKFRLFPHCCHSSPQSCLISNTDLLKHHRCNLRPRHAFRQHQHNPQHLALLPRTRPHNLSLRQPRSLYLRQRKNLQLDSKPIPLLLQPQLRHLHRSGENL